MYYEKELSTIQSHCSMKTSQMAWKIKSAILENSIENRHFSFGIKDDNMRYAIIYPNKQLYFSNLRYPLDFDLNNEAYYFENRNVHILKLKDKSTPFRYIVVEDISGLSAIDKLRLLVLGFVLLGIFFIAFFGYILSKILIKPIKENFEQLNNFVKDSSHELNTPIAALFMISSKLKHKQTIDDKMLMQLGASTKNIKQAYDSLLFRANQESIKRYDEYVNLKEVVQESILFFDELLQSKNITLHANLNETEVFMDRYCATIIINNLLSNAIKYTKKEKNIYINLHNRQFSIKDEGIGIKDKMQKKIFQRYQRGTKMAGGFGLGLDIVKSICEKYNIALKLHSKLGQGSTFSLIFTS